MSYAIFLIIQLHHFAFAGGVTEWINRDGWIQAVERSSLAMRNPGDFLGWVRQQRYIDQLQHMENDLLAKEQLAGTVGDVDKLVRHDVCKKVNFDPLKQVSFPEVDAIEF